MDAHTFAIVKEIASNIERSARKIKKTKAATARGIVKQDSVPVRKIEKIATKSAYAALGRYLARRKHASIWLVFAFFVVLGIVDV